MRTAPFTIGQDLLASRCLSDLIHYFKGQRASGAFDRADRSARLFGSDQRKDVHGGWYDASGDVSKYLSHLSYANYLNPQQTPHGGLVPAQVSRALGPAPGHRQGQPLQAAQRRGAARRGFSLPDAG